MLEVVVADEFNALKPDGSLLIIASEMSNIFPDKCLCSDRTDTPHPVPVKSLGVKMS